MSLVNVDPHDATPIYAQLERGLRAAIATGRLRSGDQLPTVRQLAVDLRVNANTVARVYAELERAGVIETRRGIGSFISATPARAHPPRDQERRMRAFVTRVLADADRSGFRIDEVIAALDEHRPSTFGRAQGRPEPSQGARVSGRPDRVEGRKEGT